MRARVTCHISLRCYRVRVGLARLDAASHHAHLVVPLGKELRAADHNGRDARACAADADAMSGAALQGVSKRGLTGLPRQGQCILTRHLHIAYTQSLQYILTLLAALLTCPDAR